MTGDTGLNTPIMRKPRSRISIPKEDRIWNLRCQGYDYESIARIANVAKGTPRNVVRRVRRRPPLEKDPIKRGRYSGFLSDSQITEIRIRRASGEKLMTIAKDFCLEVSSICKIALSRTYAEPCADETCTGYQFDFANRLMHR